MSDELTLYSEQSLDLYNDDSTDLDDKFAGEVVGGWRGMFPVISLVKTGLTFRITVGAKAMEQDITPEGPPLKVLYVSVVDLDDARTLWPPGQQEAGADPRPPVCSSQPGDDYGSFSYKEGVRWNRALNSQIGLEPNVEPAFDQTFEIKCALCPWSKFETKSVWDKTLDRATRAPACSESRVLKVVRMKKGPALDGGEKNAFSVDPSSAIFEVLTVSMATNGSMTKIMKSIHTAENMKFIQRAAKAGKSSKGLKMSQLVFKLTLTATDDAYKNPVVGVEHAGFVLPEEWREHLHSDVLSPHIESFKKAVAASKAAWSESAPADPAPEADSGEDSIPY